MRDQPDEREGLTVAKLDQQVVEETRRRLLMVVQQLVLRPSGLLEPRPESQQGPNAVEPEPEFAP
eukprot:3866009-Heterocapsa_arctica.AAC.1